MKKYAQLQYQGLNLLDEIGTVELTIDCEQARIHVYDTQQIVAPEYCFQTKQDQLTESFYKMATVVRQKNFLQVKDSLTIEQWVRENTWYFYNQTTTIKRYAEGNMTREHVESSKWAPYFHNAYIERLP